LLLFLTKKKKERKVAKRVAGFAVRRRKKGNFESWAGDVLHVGERGEKGEREVGVFASS